MTTPACPSSGKFGSRFPRRTSANGLHIISCEDTGNIWLSCLGSPRLAAVQGCNALTKISLLPDATGLFWVLFLNHNRLSHPLNDPK
ncbi:hypothetical protein VUR80DRAFT_1315 [Thermomyces stellatus]